VLPHRLRPLCGPISHPQKVKAGIAKSATTLPTTTVCTVGVGPTKEFHSPHRKPPDRWPNPSETQPHEQCSHTTSAMPQSQTGQRRAAPKGFPGLTGKP